MRTFNNISTAMPACWLACVSLSLGLVACQPAEKTSADDYFPLAAGHTWQYQQSVQRDAGADNSTSPLPASLTLSNLGMDTVSEAGSDVQAAHRRSSDGMNYWLQKEASGIYRIGSRFEMEEWVTMDQPKRMVLPNPLTVGSRWSATTTPYLLERMTEFPRELKHKHPKVPMAYHLEAIEQSVSTPAGHFSHCLVVKGEAALKLFVDPVVGWQDVPLLSTEWYCAGVGLVKVVRDEHTSSLFLNGGQLTLELTDWH